MSLANQAVRILVTGNRNWEDRAAIQYALNEMMRGFPAWRPVVLVHGDAAGADSLADDIWLGWRRTMPALYSFPERHPAAAHPDPLTRNQHMVNLGADVCLCFSLRWASGAGNCARAARRARIFTMDYGVSTRVEDRFIGGTT